MCKRRTLRALVQARLTAAAEEIFALFERTIAEYEEELCLSREENQRKQELLELLSPGAPLHTAGVQMPSLSRRPGLNQEIPETPQAKEEPEELRIKQEEVQLPVAFYVKTEDSMLLEQTHISEFIQEEGDLLHSADEEEDCRAPFSRSATEADRDHNHVQIRARRTVTQNLGQSPRYKSAPETSGTGNMLGTLEGVEELKYQCSFCEKAFGRRHNLRRHIKIHTGEQPYSCSICKRMFSEKCNLTAHRRIHTGEKPFSCPTCKKQFSHKTNLNQHLRTHTGERPYSCPVCSETFSYAVTLRTHMRKHTGEQPFICSICNKGFNQCIHLDIHMRTHEKSFTAAQSIGKHSILEIT